MPRRVLPSAANSGGLNVELGLGILGEEAGKSAIRQEVRLLIPMNDINPTVRHHVVPTSATVFAFLAGELYDLLPIGVAHVHDLRHRVPPFVKQFGREADFRPRGLGKGHHVGDLVVSG